MKKTLLATTLSVILLGGYSLTAKAKEPLPSLSDGNYVALSGSVVSVADEEFVLDYGEGNVIVEMENWDWYRDLETRLQPGQEVSLSGQIDDDLFEGREVKAQTVYVKDRNTFYYADGVDPSYYLYTYTYVPASDASTTSQNNMRQQTNNQMANANTNAGNLSSNWNNKNQQSMQNQSNQSAMNPVSSRYGTSPEQTTGNKNYTAREDMGLNLTRTVSGKITDIIGREIVVKNDEGSIRVDTAGMAYNPLDNRGYQRLQEGDEVYVSGEMGNAELSANVIVTLDKQTS